MVLTDEELNKVSGGLTNDEIVKKINLLFVQLPSDIREIIIGTLNNYGKKPQKN